MDMPAQKFYLSVSWEEFHQTTKKLALLLYEKGPWDTIVAVSRGGLVPAAIIAKELNIRIVDTICVASYEDNKKNKLKILKPMVSNSSAMLLIDDLVDTGETARAIKVQLPSVHYATVYAKPKTKTLVDTFVTEIDPNTWIIFPWDE